MHRVQRDRLELPAGIPQPGAEKRYQPFGQHWPRGPELAEILLVEPIGRDSSESGCVRTPGAAIERGNFTQQLASRSMTKTQFAAIFGGYGQPHAALGNEVEPRRTFSPDEQSLAFFELGFAKRRDAGLEVLDSQALEQLCLRQEGSENFFAGH